MFKKLGSKIKKIDKGVIHLLLSIAILVLVVLIYTRDSSKKEEATDIGGLKESKAQQKALQNVKQRAQRSQQSKKN